MAAKENARRAEAERKAEQEKAADLRRRRADARAAAEKVARQRAAELERREAAKRSMGAKQAAQLDPMAATARANFLDALRDLAPRCPSRDFGFA
jgi:hypothetical protein